MAQHSTFGSFMAEEANVTRWSILRLQVLVFLFMFYGFVGGVNTVIHDPERIIFPLFLSLATPFAMAAGEYTQERYERHGRIDPLYISALVLILVLVVWYRLHR